MSHHGLGQSVCRRCQAAEPCERTERPAPRVRLLRFAALILATAGLLLLSSCQPPLRATPTSSRSSAILATPLPIGPTRPASTSAPTPTVAAIPTATPTVVATPTANIVVTDPVRDQSVQSPVLVAGQARVFEAALEFDIISDGKTLGRGWTTASMGAPEWGAYNAQLNFDAPGADGAGTVRVFSRSPKDGSIINLVEIPVRIRAQSSAATPAPGPSVSPSASAPAPTPTAKKPPTSVPGTIVTPAAGTPPAGTRRITIYFVKTVGNDVQFVGVNRFIPTTPAIGRASLEELLKGPTAQEKAQGLTSPIPAGTRLLGLRIEGTTAQADFDSKIESNSGGSVQKMSIRRVIELTLTQFSTVDRVVISVQGKTEGVLQP